MSRATSYTAIRSAWTYLALAMTFVLVLSTSPWASAEDTLPESTDVPAVVENPAPPAEPAPELPPVENPPAAPEPPVVPEPQPTLPPTSVPEAPIVPEPVETEPVVTEVPVTVEPTPEVTPEPTATQTPDPTPEPTATAEPTPVITWSQTEPVQCVLRDGQAAGLKYAQSRTYRCDVSAHASSDLAMPADMEIEWTLDVNFPDGYVLQFPQGSQARVKQQKPGASATATKYTITHPWKQGDEQKLVFDLVVSRNTCAVGEQVLSIQANPRIETIASEAVIRRQEGNVHPDPVRLISPVVDSAAPNIAFDGSVSFDAISATAAGLQKKTTLGSASIVVTGDWDPCITWTVDLTGAVDVPAETPAQFRVVSINNEPISGDSCDLSVPCEVIVLPQTGNAVTPLRYTIGLELQFHELTPVGDFGVGLQTEVHGEGDTP